MSGLLDKAKAKEDEIINNSDKENNSVEGVKKEHKKNKSVNNNVESKLLMKNPIFISGIIGLLVSMVGLYYLKYIPGIAVLGIFLCSYIAAGYSFTGGFKIDSESKKKWISLGVIWLLFGALPYLGGASTGGNISLLLDSENPFDESTNTINMVYYSSGGLFGSGIGEDVISVTVKQDGESLWTGEVNGKPSVTNVNNGEISLDIDDFYNQNALYVSDIQEVSHPELGLLDAPVMSSMEYTVIIESASGILSNEMKITDSIITRTITDIDGELSLFVDSNDLNGDGDTEDSGEKSEGVILSGWFGHMADSFDGALRPGAVQSEYTITTSISFDGSVVFDYPLITVSGTTALWDDSVYGDGAGKVGETSSDFEYQGDQITSSGISYISKDKIYDGDGCYTLTITISNSEAYSSPDYFPNVIEEVNYDWKGGETDEETLEKVNTC
tara:strand:+ start:1448 stop:2776 length:1329 start_codon:yes stop_codon:yes gene_type:complete